MNSKFRDLERHVQLNTELDIVIDDVVANLTENPFISPNRRKLLAEKALAIREEFQRSRPDLTESIAQWNQLSKPRIISQVLGIVAWSLAAGIITAIVMFRFVHITVSQFVSTLVIVLVAAGVFAGGSFRRLLAKRRKSTWNLNYRLENSVEEALSEFAGREAIRRGVKLQIGDRGASVDFVLSLHGVSIPVEIHANISERVIDQISSHMGFLKTERGVIITPDIASDKLRRKGHNQGVMIIDNISSKDDLVSRLKNAALAD